MQVMADAQAAAAAVVAAAGSPIEVGVAGSGLAGTAALVGSAADPVAAGLDAAGPSTADPSTASVEAVEEQLPAGEQLPGGKQCLPWRPVMHSAIAQACQRLEQLRAEGANVTVRAGWRGSGVRCM